jgi:hypothetical protein
MNNTSDKMLEHLLKITEENRRNGIIDVTISADSVRNEKRITTFILNRFPKGALQSQLNTHRSLSKNSASSRRKFFMRSRASGIFALSIATVIED